jgi:hypothetical protein
MAPELKGEIMIRSPNLYGDPQTVMRYLSQRCHCSPLALTPPQRLRLRRGKRRRSRHSRVPRQTRAHGQADRSYCSRIGEVHRLVVAREGEPSTRLEISSLKIVEACFLYRRSSLQPIQFYKTIQCHVWSSRSLHHSTSPTSVYPQP